MGRKLLIPILLLSIEICWHKIQNPDDDDLYVPIQLHDKLVHHLEEDFVLINKKNKIIKLPAELNVVQILENFVRHFAANMTNTPIIGVRSDPVINEGVPGKFPF